MNRNQYELCHYGVKGMKWGVRKKREKSSYIPSARVTLQGKTKHGEPIIARQDKQPTITTFLARHNLKMRKQVENTKAMTLYNKSGNRIGDLQLFHESPTSVNVTWVGIDEKNRGKGYAQAAMKMAEDYARKSGAKQMTLEVPGNSPDARHIYERQGFKEVGVLSTPDDDFVWGGLTAMVKKIN